MALTLVWGNAGATGALGATAAGKALPKESHNGISHVPSYLGMLATDPELAAESSFHCRGTGVCGVSGAGELGLWGTHRILHEQRQLLLKLLVVLLSIKCKTGHDVCLQRLHWPRDHGLVGVLQQSVGVRHEGVEHSTPPRHVRLKELRDVQIAQAVEYAGGV